MTIPTLSTLPTAPARTDAPATFVTRADAFLAALVTFQSEMNTSIGAMNTDIAGVNADATAAADSAASAIASANFKGAWSSLTGALNIPASVTHNGSLWILLNNLADVTASEPGVSADWQDLPVIPSQSGQAGKFLTTNGTSTSWGSLAAAGEIERTAAANITAGDPVAILSNGEVTPITGTQTAGFQSPYYEISGGNRYTMMRTAYDESGDAIVMLATNTSTGNLQSFVGTISGSTITWGSATTVDTNGNLYHDIAYDPDTDRWLAVYRDISSGQGYARVGQRVSTTMTWGTASAFDTNSCTEMGLVYDTANDTFVVSYSRSGTLYTNVITVSGLSFTAGTPTNHSYSMTQIASIYDSTNSRIVTAGRNGSSNVALIAFTSDGSTLTRIGTQAEMTAGGSSTTNPSIAYDPIADAYIVGHCSTNAARSVKLFANAVNLTGTTYTVGADFYPAGNQYDQDFNSAYKPSQYVVYVPDLQQTLIRRAPYDASGITLNSYVGVTCSGTTLSFGANAFNYDARYFGKTFRNQAYAAVQYLPDTKSLIFFSSTDVAFTPNAFFNTMVNFGSTSTNADNYFGIAADTFTATNTGTINIIGGSNTSVTGLSAGSEYWLDYDGSLSATDTGYAKVGTATSATSIFLKGGAEDPTTPTSSGRILTQVGSSVTAGDALFINAQGLPATVEIRPQFDYTSSDVYGGYQDPTSGSGVTSDYFYANLPTPDGGGILVTKDNSSAYMRAIPWTNNAGTITFGTAVSVKNGYGMSGSNYHFNALWNRAGGFWNVIINDTSNNVFLQAWSKSGTTLTVEHDLSLSNSGGTHYGAYMAWNPDENHLGLLLQHQAGSHAFIFRAYSFSGYTASQVGSQYYPVHYMAYDVGFGYNPKSNLFQLCGSSNTFGTFRYYSLEFGGTNYTAVSSGTLSGITYQTSYSRIADLEYDVNSDHMFYMRYDAGNTVRVFAIEISGNTLSKVGTEYSNTNAYYYSQCRANFFTNDPVSNMDYGGFNFAGVVFDGTTVTAPYSGSYPNTSYQHNFYFNPANGKVFYGMRLSNTQFQCYEWIYSDANDEAFFGFAATNGQQGLNAQVDLIGGINTSQSGLTAGSVYYAGLDGSISTTESSYRVGKAISSTKMYVTG